MLEGIEALSKDVLYIIIFLVPGYIGFQTTLMIFSVLFKPFKYRSKKISTLDKAIISILWSALTFAIMFNVWEIEQLFSSVNIKNMALMVVISVGIAEFISIGFWILFLVIFGFNTILDFITYSDKTLPFISLPRLKLIWSKHYQNLQKILSDDNYYELYSSAANKKIISLHLINGKTLKGIVIKEKVIDITQFKFDVGNEIFIISLEDVYNISIPKNPQ
ncbi:hypothetical protein HYX08_04265 [Candidatus Woesearchaeota archaeon]|nr:hypothetical protein [Candidatus Woesearchaeota archaeon]